MVESCGRGGVRRRWAAILSAALVLLALPGCSVRRLAVNALADSLASGGAVYASDDDPELVGDALPFALKTIESLLAEAPRHPGLLLAATSGFTQYAHAFVEGAAAPEESGDYEASERRRRRAQRLYLRARGYGLRGLEVEHPGLAERLLARPEAAAAELELEDVPLAYWTAAAWGSAIGAGKDRPELVADVPAVRALLERALELDEDWDAGALHAALVPLAALPAAMGGSWELAARHFERAAELSGGLDAGLFVTYAEAVALPRQDRAAFARLLQQALAVDPELAPQRRLANLVAQRRARALRQRADELFLEEAEP
jgi:predicted anti-sigma-YlaC factor YlaD